MEAILRDIHVSLRSLKNDVRFTSVAVITLALGIGANVAIFSVVNAVLLEDLPYPNPEQLVEVGTAMTDGRFTNGLIAPVEMHGVVDGANTLSAVSGTFLFDVVFLAADDRPIKAVTYVVPEGFFDVFRTPMLLGRGSLTRRG